MTITDLQIQLDLCYDDKVKILKKVASKVDEGFFFVDSEDGQCYLFDESGNLGDVTKVKTLYEEYIKKDIKKIVIPNSVTSIRAYTFDSCGRLTNVMIPDSVTKIDDSVFYGCYSLTSITIPDSVVSIGYGAFVDCDSLINVTIGNNVTSIGSDMFYYCSSLMNLTIPDSVMRIGDNAFSNCGNLKSVIFKGKTLEQVKDMNNYPFGIENESIIRCKS